ncbi:type VII secretion target [Mycobacterium sp. 2YAF39]|uniref:hypothetical protein n=1 Tax=Mycobacterium sp. 2YAF39 TaxID=3233033 RepID=UPI003F9C6E42
MSGDTLKVNPQVLQAAAATFGDVAEGLARLQSGAAIGHAATAGQLLTADSYRKAQQGIAVAVAAAAQSVRMFGEDLDTALRAYTAEGESGAATIVGLDIPG